MVDETDPFQKGTKAMFNIKLPTTIIALCGRVLPLAAIGAAGLALLGASAASAQPVQGTNPSKGCPVEDEHGNTTYVPVGTRIGLFVCGSDGEWHFGWLITGRQAPQQPVGSPTGTSSGARKVSVYVLYKPSGSQSALLAVSQAKASTSQARCKSESTGMDRHGRMYKCKSGVWVLLWVHKQVTGIRRPVATPGSTGIVHANLVVNHPGGAPVYPIHTGTTNVAMEGHTTGDDGAASEEECQKRGEHLDGLATDIRNAEAAGGYDLTNQVDQFKSELASALDAGCFIMD